MARLKEMDYTYIKMDLSITENGIKTSKMVKEQKNEKMGLSMKANMLTELRMDKDVLNGKMEVNMRVHLTSI